MKKETADNLKSIFDKYDEKQLDAQKKQKKAESERQIFLNNFAKVCSEIIRPTMEEFSEVIKSRGQFCEITQQTESHDSEGRTTPAKIQMKIYPHAQERHYGREENYPSISFIADISSNNIWTHVSTIMLSRGGSAGSRNQYTLERINREIVEEEVLYLLKECFGK